MTSENNIPALSNGDESILEQVFDPESSPDTPKAKIVPSLPSDPHVKDQSLLSSLKAREIQAIRLIEERSTSTLPSLPIHGSQQGKLNKSPGAEEMAKKKHDVYSRAFTILSSIISEHPEYASAYNNRAQLRRWRYGDLIGLSNCSENNDASTAMDLAVDDLDTAIKLASPETGEASVSPAQAKLLAQSWTQKGAIYWALGRAKQGDDGSIKPQPLLRGSGWQQWHKMHLEEEGSRCFFMAGLYGSEIGRTMAVKANPYARLCGSIVKEAMRREVSIGYT